LYAIKAAAAQFMQKEARLDVLINSAGTMTTPMDWVTKQGYDMQFGTNVLGAPLHFVLSFYGLKS
jgi:NAD(P)-dependent dehydrogenase (short-subunit alcohol dehydrogenase family)